MYDEIMKEFARELLNFKATCVISDELFASMLTGAAAAASESAGISLGRSIAAFAKAYYTDGVANDD